LLIDVFVGIDVGAERLHCVAANEDLRLADSAVFAATELDDLVDRVRGAASIAVDAPSDLSTAPHADDTGLGLKFRTGRCAEIALGRDFGYWVPWVTPTAAPEVGWMATGFALYQKLRAAGIEPIEVFPYAAYRELVRPERLPKKQAVAGLRARAAALRMLGVREAALQMWSHDGLDAFVGAVVARDHARGDARAATCGHDASAIWLPATQPPDARLLREPRSRVARKRRGSDV
jgi:predicted nuclease with RNAse H fold